MEGCTWICFLRLRLVCTWWIACWMGVRIAIAIACAKYFAVPAGVGRRAGVGAGLPGDCDCDLLSAMPARYRVLFQTGTTLAVELGTSQLGIIEIRNRPMSLDSRAGRDDDSRAGCNQSTEVLAGVTSTPPFATAHAGGDSNGTIESVADGARGSQGQILLLIVTESIIEL